MFAIQLLSNAVPTAILGGTNVTEGTHTLVHVVPTAFKPKYFLEEHVNVWNPIQERVVLWSMDEDERAE